jgi:phosphohistidine phosphatase
MNRIYLVQHGEAASKAVHPERPLTDKGIADISAMARFLKQGGVPIGRILHSGKLRAEQSAGILAQALTAGAAADAIKHINPNDPVREFAGKLKHYGTDSLFVGHLPFMEKLVAYLVCGSEDCRSVAFTPGSVVCLSAIDGKSWNIEWMIRPELIL